MPDTGNVCFLVREDGKRDTWRIGVTSRPVVDFARAESKRLGTKVYPAHTPTYGSSADAKRIERYLSNYALGDGWFGPLSDETMKSLTARIRKEGLAFLDGHPLSQ